MIAVVIDQKWTSKRREEFKRKGHYRQRYGFTNLQETAQIMLFHIFLLRVVGFIRNCASMVKTQMVLPNWE